MRVGRSGRQSTGCHVPQPLPRAGEREEEATPGDSSDRFHADVGLSGSSEAAHWCGIPSSCAAASMWLPPQGVVDK